MWKLIKLPTSLFVKLNECQRNEWSSMTNEVDVFSLPKIWEVVQFGSQLDPPTRSQGRKAISVLTFENCVGCEFDLELS